MYESFIAVPTAAAAASRLRPAELTPERCFQIQLLLIHFYRRVVLKDPLLPEELLPAHWAGKPRASCASIFINACARRAGVRQRERRKLGGRTSRAGPLYYQRFGGLPGA
jgi:phenylacetic acid degradation operon negative regulatory protein